MGRTACTKPQCLYKGALYLLPLHGFDPRTVEIVASRYTDYTIPAHYERLTG
jgi:hypothetical protein